MDAAGGFQPFGLRGIKRRERFKHEAGFDVGSYHAELPTQSIKVQAYVRLVDV